MKFKSLCTCLILFVTQAWSIAQAYEANRPFAVHQLEEVGLEVWVPQRPEWQLGLDSGSRSTPSVVLNTPELYYPATAIEIVLNKNLLVPEADLRKVAETAIKEIRMNSGLNGNFNAPLKSARYGDIEGYSHTFNIDFQGATYSMEVIVGRFSSGEAVTLLVTTPEGQLNHIDVMKSKIFRKLSLL